MREVCRHHGLPDSIISDRGPQFVSKFWKHLFKMLKVTCKLSSIYHPQIDGQVERTNQTLEQYLRCFLSYHQDDWADIHHYTILCLYGLSPPVVSIGNPRVTRKSLRRRSFGAVTQDTRGFIYSSIAGSVNTQGLCGSSSASIHF